MVGNTQTVTRDDTDILVRRIIAATIDFVILTFLGFIIWTIIALGFTLMLETGKFLISSLLMLVATSVIGLFAYAYFLFLEGWRGQTLGKFIMGIKVVKENGTPCTFGASFIRNIFRIIDFLPFYYLLGFIVVALTEKRQRIGDRLAGTVVIRKK